MRLASCNLSELASVGCLVSSHSETSKNFSETFKTITTSDVTAGSRDRSIIVVAAVAATADPFSSNRQHLSYDGCLELRGKIIRNVLCCIVY